jgi:hypothetical protein
MRQTKGRLDVAGFLGGVFDVADGVVHDALRLVHLAFRLHAFVAGHLPDRILDSALGFVGRALHVFLVHYKSPAAECHDSKRSGARMVPSQFPDAGVDGRRLGGQRRVSAAQAVADPALPAHTGDFPLVVGSEMLAVSADRHIKRRGGRMLEPLSCARGIPQRRVFVA